MTHSNIMMLYIVKKITTRAYTSERTCNSLLQGVIAVPVDFHLEYLTNHPLRSLLIIIYDIGCLRISAVLQLLRYKL